jgi:hypothetical protein
MKEFDFRKYLKQNPLLKESVNEKFSNWQPGFEDFWDRVYDGAIEKAIEISKESGDGMNIEEISKAIENECANPNRVMQALEADGEVDEAISYVLDSLEIGEPMGMGDTQKAFLYNPTNQVGFNPMREDEDAISEADSMIFDKGWEYDDDDFGSDDEEQFPDEREMFLGQGGQEILDKIKYLVGAGFPLQDIMKQIRQHSNYLQSPTINEDMYGDENPFPSLNTGKADSFIQSQRDAAGSGGYVSDYYAGAPGISNDVKVIAANVDKVLNGLDIPEEEWINLSDLIIDLADAYADFRIDMYTDGQMD